MAYRKPVYLIAVLLLCTSFRAFPEAEARIFVVLTTPDVQTQLMVMVLSTQMNAQHRLDGILLCGPAGDLALEGDEGVILKPVNKSPQMLLRSLIAGGVTVQVCPLYLPNKGLTPEYLVAGVTEARLPLVAGHLLEHGVRLFTF